MQHTRECVTDLTQFKEHWIFLVFEYENILLIFFFFGWARFWCYILLFWCWTNVNLLIRCLIFWGVVFVMNLRDQKLINFSIILITCKKQSLIQCRSLEFLWGVTNQQKKINTIPDGVWFESSWDLDKNSPGKLYTRIFC